MMVLGIEEVNFALHAEGWKILCGAPGCSLVYHWPLAPERLDGIWMGTVYPSIVPVTTDLPRDIERFFSPSQLGMRSRTTELCYSAALAHQLGESRDQQELDMLRSALDASANLVLQEFGHQPNHEYSYSGMIDVPGTGEPRTVDIGVILRTGEVGDAQIALAMTMDELLVVGGCADSDTVARVLSEDGSSLPN